MFYSVNGPAAEVLLAFEGKSPVGVAVFFHNFSTWLGRPGLYRRFVREAGEARQKLLSRIACRACEGHRRPVELEKYAQAE
jgi:hypothetical protein